MNSFCYTVYELVVGFKTRGQRGSCCALSSAGGLEGSWEVSTGSLVSIYERQLGDCSNQNRFCNGGIMDSEFSLYRTKEILIHASVIPRTHTFTGKAFCKAFYTGNAFCLIIRAHKEAMDVLVGSGLMSAFDQQPVSVAIEAELGCAVISFGPGCSLGETSNDCASSSDFPRSVGISNRRSRQIWCVSG